MRYPKKMLENIRLMRIPGSTPSLESVIERLAKTFGDSAQISILKAMAFAKNASDDCAHGAPALAVDSIDAAIALLEDAKQRVQGGQS